MGEHDEHIIFEMGYNKGFKDGIKGSIPKADYENRLKADMLAMLEEIQDKIFKESWRLECICDDLDGSAVDLDDINRIFQQKINSLKENKDGDK